MTEGLRPFRPIPPSEILAEELEARGWAESVLADATAGELSRALGTSREFWLNLEAAYRLDVQLQN